MCSVLLMYPNHVNIKEEGGSVEAGRAGQGEANIYLLPFREEEGGRKAGT